MLKVGITGGIGSGKTTVCKIFEQLHVPVFYADLHAKLIMTDDPQLVAGIRSAFGEASYSGEGILNNKFLASVVFNDEMKLAQLNKLVHPAVFRAFESWIVKIPGDTPYILKEAALLFESDSYKMCDKSILVTAPEAVRIQRVMERDDVTESAVRLRMDKQLADKEKEKLADFLILNDGRHSLIEQVLSLHHQFIMRL